jgi:hypothetical protein
MIGVQYFINRLMQRNNLVFQISFFQSIQTTTPFGTGKTFYHRLHYFLLLLNLFELLKKYYFDLSSSGRQLQKKIPQQNVRDF